MTKTNKRRISAFIIFASAYLAVEVCELHNWLNYNNGEWDEEDNSLSDNMHMQSLRSGRGGGMLQSVDFTERHLMELKSAAVGDDTSTASIADDGKDGGKVMPFLDDEIHPSRSMAEREHIVIDGDGLRDMKSELEKLDHLEVPKISVPMMTTDDDDDILGMKSLENALADLTERMGNAAAAAHATNSNNENPSSHDDKHENYETNADDDGAVTYSVLDGDVVLPEPLEVCGRPAPLHLKLKEIVFGWRKAIISSDVKKPRKKLLLLETHTPYGRSGNMILAFLHAFDYARDHDMDIGMRKNCWAMDAILEMWMENNEEKAYDWMVRVESALDIKIIRTDKQLLQYEEVKSMGAKELYEYKTPKSVEETKPFHMFIILTLFRFYNTGTGVDHKKNNVKDVCTGINDLFGDSPKTLKYSVIHSRNLEGKGYDMLKRLSRGKFCDQRAAVDLKPDYIKAILGPIGMLKHPIVFISDGERPEVYDRLKNDPDIGPQLRQVSKEASWVGGDITLAIMSNAFIGNPASTMSGFINRARDSLGFDKNYLFMTKKSGDSGDDWVISCDRDCIWDRRIMMSMA